MLNLFLAMALEAQTVPSEWARLPACASPTAPISEPCTLPLSVTPAQAVERLGGKDQVAWTEQDRLTMIARPTVEKWAMLCCTIQTPLEPILGTDLAGVTVRVPRLDEAVLAVGVFPAKDDARQVMRGRYAPPVPPMSMPPAARLIRTELISKVLGERRGITIYLPCSLRSNRPPPILYLADDAAADFAPIAEALIRAGRAKPMILVGIEAAKAPAGCHAFSCDRRGREYKIDLNPRGAAPDTDFGRHLRFVTDELIPYVEARYGGRRSRAERGIGGWSNGAHWALAAAGLRPDLFGRVLALSSSGQGGAGLGAKLGCTMLFAGAGIFEADYLSNTLAAARGAEGAGAQVRTVSTVTGHEKSAWQAMFADAFPWLSAKSPR